MKRSELVNETYRYILYGEALVIIPALHRCIETLAPAKYGGIIGARTQPAARTLLVSGFRRN